MVRGSEGAVPGGKASPGGESCSTGGLGSNVRHRYANYDHTAYDHAAYDHADYDYVDYDHADDYAHVYDYDNEYRGIKCQPRFIREHKCSWQRRNDC